MIAYLDTSALIKLIVEEAGSDRAAGLIERSAAQATARVAYAEARAALARARRLGALPPGGYAAALRILEAHWSGLVAIDVSDPVVRRAGDLAERHHLRGYDAIHLASAVTLSGEVTDEVRLATWDRELAAAARAEGFVVEGEGGS